jgi:predicted esterase
MVGQRLQIALIGLILGVCACSSGEDTLLPGARVSHDPQRPPESGAGSSTGTNGGSGAATPATPPGSGAPKPGVDDPGPAPAGTCAIPKGELVARDSGASSYVAYVPASYNGAPTRLLVGLHGCGDSAWNFAGWGVNPNDTRGAQDYIGIAVDGASAGGSCWNTSDESKVLAAIDDISKCLYVHKQKVVVAGFSSGGILAYRVGLKNASRFAGIMILNASLSSTGEAETLLGGASWNINIAHRAHMQDGVFPIGTVQGDWQKMQSAGFPIETSQVDGGHDGTSQDWTDWLIPQMASWKAP